MQELDINVDCGYDNKGAFLKLEVRIPYSSLKTFKLPESCIRCPCAFMDYGCGRNAPFLDEDYIRRPTTCKLKQVSIEEIVRKIKEG